MLALVATCGALAWPADSTLVPTEGGRPSGDPFWARLYLAAVIGAFAAYAVGLVALRLWAARLVLVAALAVAIQLAPLGAPLLLSTDAWTYWDYGRIAAVHDANPYRDTPADFPGDPAFPWAGEAWRDSTSVYGPAFTLASEPLARVAGESPDAAAWLYKALAAAAMLGAVGLAVRLARRRALACALVGWNPLLALHFAGGGHNDAWVAALVLGALAAGTAGRRQLPGVLWALAILVKWIPLVFLPLRALEARAQGRRVGHIGLAAGLALVGGLATWRYGTAWLEAAAPLARNAREETSYALPHRLAEVGLPGWFTLVLAATAFAAAYAWLLRCAWRGRARLGLAAVALLLATPYLAPWYLAWAVPLAAADDDDTAGWLSVALTAYLLPQTVPI